MSNTNIASSHAKNNTNKVASPSKLSNSNEYYQENSGENTKTLTKPPYVIGPEGTALTIADLPPANTGRWVVRRKAEVIAAVKGGMITMQEACEKYSLTYEEFISWRNMIDKHGLLGLRSTRLQHYKAKSK